MAQHFLTDAEMHALISGNPFTLGLSIARLKDFIRQVEKAVMAKLHKQEPVAVVASDFQLMHRGGAAISEIEGLKVGMVLYAHPVASVSESAESEDQDIELLKQALETMIRAAHPAYVQEDWLREKLIKARDTAFKALRANRLNAKERHRTTKNSDKPHLIGAKVYTAEETELQLSYIKLYQKWRRGEDKTMSEMGLTSKQIGESLDWLIGVVENHTEGALELARNQPCGCIVCYCENQERCLGCGAKYCGAHEVGEIPNPVYVDHIPDAGKMITGHQSNSIDESHAKIMPLVQNYADKRVMAVYGNAGETEVHEAYCNLAARIQAELEALQENSSHIADMRKKVPEGWQLVPKEPTPEMTQAATSSDEEYSKRSFGEGIHLCQGGYDHYLVMLAAAPKYTEDK